MSITMRGGRCTWAMILAVGLAVPVCAQPATWIIDPVPLLEIGTSTNDPTDQFGRVIAAALAPDGGVFVLDASPAAVRRFASDGTPRRDLGREGDGPGEFRGPLDLALVGEVVVVVDAMGRRTRFDEGGRVLGDDHVDAAVACGPDWNPRIGGLLSDGSVVVRCEERLFGRVRGEYRQTVGLVRVPPDGGRPDTLGWFPADSGRVDEGGVPIPRPYVPPNRLLLADASGRLFLASSDQPRIRVLGLDGRDLGVGSVPASPRAVTPEDLARHAESMLRVGGSANDQRVIGEWVDGMPVAAHTPALKSLIAAGADELWVESWDADSRGSRWLVVDGEARLIAEVRAPPETEILAIAGDRVLGLWRDVLGVERVRVYTLRRTRGVGG